MFLGNFSYLLYVRINQLKQNFEQVFAWPSSSSRLRNKRTICYFLLYESCRFLFYIGNTSHLALEPNFTAVNSMMGKKFYLQVCNTKICVERRNREVLVFGELVTCKEARWEKTVLQTHFSIV